MNNRSTQQRKVILEELRSVCTHPTASEIYNMAKKRIPGIGLATVYRTLDYLNGKGLVIKLRSKGDEARYDGNVDGHAHLICKKCGTVEDIFDMDVRINSKQMNKLGFSPNVKYLEIPGLCKVCNSTKIIA